jgi:hypothetical protein
MSRAAFGCVWFRRLGFSCFVLIFCQSFVRVGLELGQLDKVIFWKKYILTSQITILYLDGPSKLPRLAFRPTTNSPFFGHLCQFMPSKWMEMSHVFYTRLNSIKTLENALLFKREITRFSL